MWVVTQRESCRVVPNAHAAGKEGSKLPGLASSSRAQGLPKSYIVAGKKKSTNLILCECNDPQKFCVWLDARRHPSIQDRTESASYKSALEGV